MIVGADGTDCPRSAFALVRQSEERVDLKSTGCGFESHLGHHFMQLETVLQS